MIDHDNLDAFADAEVYDIADPTDTGGAFYRALAQEHNPRWPGLATRPEPYEGMFFYLETWAEERTLESYIDTQGHSVQVSHAQAYDHVAQILHLASYKRWHDGEQEQTQVTRTALRYIFPQELAALLHAHGFAIIRQYGDWNYEPLTEASPSIIVVCRRQ